MSHCEKRPPSDNPCESGEHCPHPEVFRNETVTILCGFSKCHDRHEALRCCWCGLEVIGPRIPTSHGPFA